MTQTGRFNYSFHFYLCFETYLLLSPLEGPLNKLGIWLPVRVISNNKRKTLLLVMGKNLTFCPPYPRKRAFTNYLPNTHFCNPGGYAQSIKKSLTITSLTASEGHDRIGTSPAGPLQHLPKSVTCHPELANDCRLWDKAWWECLDSAGQSLVVPFIF